MPRTSTSTSKSNSPLETALNNVPSQFRSKVVKCFLDVKRRLAEGNDESLGLAAGKCVVANPRDEHWAFDSHLMRLRFDRQQAEPEFIRHLFMTAGGRRLFLGASRKSTVQFNINTKEISALMIPVPPFTLQHEFAGRIALVEKLKATYCASLAKLDTLFDLLQHRAFRGEL